MVNAGGVLLIKLSPVVTSSGPVQALIIIAGLATLYGAAIMLAKPDIKGALAHSTMAQMGFMILTCGLGLWAAAVFHLVAHGFYKATSSCPPARRRLPATQAGPAAGRAAQP